MVSILTRHTLPSNAGAAPAAVHRGLRGRGAACAGAPACLPHSSAQTSSSFHRLQPSTSQLILKPNKAATRPTLHPLTRRCCTAVLLQILCELTSLVQYVRQHMRRFLPDLLRLVHAHWGSATRQCLDLLRELSISLRDDVRWGLRMKPRAH